MGQQMTAYWLNPAHPFFLQSSPGSQPHVFIYILSMAFLLQLSSFHRDNMACCCCCCCVASVVSDSQRPRGLQPTRLLCPWNFPGKSTGVGCHCLLLQYGLRSLKYLLSSPSEKFTHLYARTMSSTKLQLIAGILVLFPALMGILPTSPHLSMMPWCFSKMYLNIFDSLPQRWSPVSSP